MNQYQRSTTPPVNCPECKVGVLWSITSALARYTGVQHYVCDSCKAMYAHKIEERS